ncbi:MAG: SAM-dependent methyltransferase [Corallococcus sp.]|nr:SAM-dependent methyltransferase [Corallococcus sp.]MCM1359204.1 SAM-dependent methyltransferase [Corallococcus sp.]MCM1394594.1 SAM-dependent methyltransferase [Corallococcus sp.]
MTFCEEIVSLRNLLKVVCSNPFDKKGSDFRKVTIRPVNDKNGAYIFHIEKLTSTQAFHENVSVERFSCWYTENLEGKFKQICLLCSDRNITYLFSSKGYKRLENKMVKATERGVSNANRTKNYLLKEGEYIPAFVDLGIFTKDLKVVESKYDKFRQINRFVEIIDDALKTFGGKDISVLDFGCGKSYLTFFIYHYFTEIKKINAKIIGYDLKSEVVNNCNDTAKKYGYENLRFEVADVERDALCNERIDMVVSLHACDTATDYALAYAVKKGVKYVFSVPCCQHEINLSIKKGDGDLDSLLRYGIVKERVAALLTDSVRAMLLEDEGYSVDVMEFVDLAHSPKNLMIRAKKTKGKCSKNRAEIERLMHKYGFEQTLYKLLCK